MATRAVPVPTPEALLQLLRELKLTLDDLKRSLSDLVQRLEKRLAVGLPGALLEWLPFLDGWDREIEVYLWEDLKCNPIKRGSWAIVKELSPQDGRYLFGIYAHVSSAYLMLACVQRVRETDKVIFAAWPRFLWDYGFLQWTSFGCFLTKYDETERSFAMALVPDDPIPLRWNLKIVAILGYPKSWVLTNIVPKMPDIVHRTWVDIPDEEAYINHLGLALLTIYDRELFLKSLADLLREIGEYLVEER